MGIDYRQLRDPNAEYTMRDLAGDTMGLDPGHGDRRDVTITDVQTAMVDGNFPWTLVRVYSDAGPVGTGEAYWGAGVPELIERMTPFLVGENPLDIDRLAEHLLQRMSGEGSLAGVTVTAIAGVEVALHDLAGKLLGVPAYQLLGGKYRDSVRVYCDCHAGAADAEPAAGAAEANADETAGATPEANADEAAGATPEANADEAERVVEELGYDGLKFDLDVPTGHESDRANRHLRDAEVRAKAAIVEAVTERVGDRADVAFDCHWSFTAGSAKRLARAIEPADVWWLEDPVPPENHDVQREVTRATATPIAAGENVYRTHGHRRLVEEQAVDVVAPDLPKVGGMRETRRIAALADLYYVPVAMHNVASPVGTMASAHVGAAIPNCLAVEFHAYELDWWPDLVAEPVVEAGRIDVPDAPGLGVTLDLDVVDEHLVAGETLFDEA